MDPDSVTFNTIGMQFPAYFMSFAMAISGVFLPKATKMAVEKSDGGAFTAFFAQTARYQWMVLGLILLGFGFFGKEFVTLWMGPDFAVSYYIAIIIMCALALPLFQSVGLSILQAKNKHRFRSVVYFCIALLNVVLTWVLVGRWGVLGATVGTVISYTLGNIVIMNIYYHKVIGIKMGVFFKQLLKGLLPATLLCCPAALFLRLLPSGTWLWFFIKAGAFGVAYAAVFYFVGLNAQEKHMVCSFLKKSK